MQCTRRLRLCCCVCRLCRAKEGGRAGLATHPPPPLHQRPARKQATTESFLPHALSHSKHTTTNTNLTGIAMSAAAATTYWRIAGLTYLQVNCRARSPCPPSLLRLFRPTPTTCPLIISPIHTTKQTVHEQGGGCPACGAQSTSSKGENAGKEGGREGGKSQREETLYRHDRETLAIYYLRNPPALPLAWIVGRRWRPGQQKMGRTLPRCLQANENSPSRSLLPPSLPRSLRSPSAPRPWPRRRSTTRSSPGPLSSSASPWARSRVRKKGGREGGREEGSKCARGYTHSCFLSLLTRANTYLR